MGRKEHSARAGGPRLTRRRFLLLGAGGTALAAQPAPLRGVLDWLGTASPAAASAPSLTTLLVRPDDQLRILFEFVNLERVGQELHAIAPGPSYVRLVFGSQHTVEERIGAGTPPAGALRHRAADQSRLVFLAQPPVPYTTAALLDLASFVPNLDPRASDGGSASGAPDADVTAIEIPEGLVLTPTPDGRFVAEVDPLATGDVTEVWRARLALEDVGVVLEPPDGAPTVRALRNVGVDAFPRALDNTVRDELVRATTAYTDGAYPHHEAIGVSRLWLTSLAGGALDLSGRWDDISGTAFLISYLHRALTGRDVEVRVTARGYLAPFGHEAAMITVVERDFAADAGGGTEAILRSEQVLSILEPTVTFDSPYQPFEGRLLPFASVTLGAPPPLEVGQRQVTFGARSIPLAQAWTVTDAATGAPLQVSATARDRGGNEVAIESLELVFVPADYAFLLPGGGGPIDDLVDYYASTAAATARAIALAGQTLAMAATNAAEALATQVAVDELRLGLRAAVGATEALLGAARQPVFFPEVAEADLRPGVAGTVSGTPTTSVGTYTDDWRDHGFGPANRGGTYLALSSPVEMDFGDPSVASVATPAFVVDTLGIDLGVGSTPPPPGSTWNPADIVPATSTLLGLIKLRDVLALVPVGTDLAGDPALPHVDVELLPSPSNAERARFAFDWKAPLATKGLFVTAADLATEGLPELVHGATELSLSSVSEVGLDGSDPSTDLDALLTSFALRLPATNTEMALFFHRLRLHVPPDGSIDADPRIAGFRFFGTLGFLDPLQDFLEDVAGLDVETVGDAVLTKLGLTLPDLSFGMVNVADLRLSLQVALPFSGPPPTFGFDIGTREDPVGVTVMGIGGTMSFAVAMAARTPNPFEHLELWLAVAMEAEVDFVIGSAGVRLAIGGGIDVDAVGTVTLHAFVTLEGSLQILGLQVLSVGVEAALAYTPSTRDLDGTLQIVLAAPFGAEIRSGCEVHLSLGGSQPVGGGLSGARVSAAAIGAPTPSPSTAPPTSFANRHTQATWTDYCSSFA